MASPSSPSTFAANLRVARALSPFTQEQLARELDVTLGAVSAWERGRSVPAGDMLVRLASKLNRTAEWLFTDHEPTERAAA